jgi:hypothetical protein
MTLSALGIFSAAGAGGGPVGDYELIETQILGSSQASIVFSSLGSYSSTYKHLQIRATTRSTTASGSDGMGIRFNADTGNNYSQHGMYGGGSGSPVSFATLNQPWGYTAQIPAASATANQFNALVIDLLDPYSTTKNKTFRSFLGSTGTLNLVGLYSGAWFNTASITSITVLPFNGSFAAGTRYSLYGIRG